jgi:diguanylate cyclase (GGDEF)-like protein/PAS domain S-box-containing protein
MLEVKMKHRIARLIAPAIVVVATVAAGAGIVAGQLYSASRYEQARVISDVGLESQVAHTQVWAALSTVDAEHFVIPEPNPGPEMFLAKVDPLLDEISAKSQRLPAEGRASVSAFVATTRQIVTLIRQEKGPEAFEIQNATTRVLGQTIALMDELGDDAEREAASVITFSIGASLSFYVAVIGIITFFFRRRSKIQQELQRAIAEREVSAHSEARFRSLIQNSSSIISVVSATGAIAYQSVTVRKLGFEPTDLLRSQFIDLVHPMDTIHIENVIGQVAGEHRGTRRVECRLRTKDSDWVQMELVVQNLLDDPYVRGLVLTAVDISDRKMFEQQLEHQATHDPLTALPNRLLFRDRLQHALEAGIAGEACHAVLFLDLDDFKTVNDSLGHMAGDQFLTAVAERLRAGVRGRDTVARFGGDEFAILLEGTTRNAALEVADRIIESFETPLELDGRPVKGAISIGVVFADQYGLDADDILRDADTAMYMAKARGKGRTEQFSPAMRAAILERLELEVDMREGLCSGQFLVHYQPILDVAKNQVVGLEALARWEHPRRGMLQPSVFIPIAEESGLVVDLGALVLKTACTQVSKWQQAFPDQPPIFLTVNVSAKQLMHSGLLDELSSALEESGLPASSLTLEITETVLAHNTEAVIERLKAMRSLGVRLAIDDFGTGYSSLSYLHQFPVDVVKIDKSFVDGITRPGEGTELPDAIVALAHALKLKTVAEGVETTEQVEHLTSIGCDLWQGFFFARPLEERVVEELLADPAWRRPHGHDAPARLAS